MTAFAERIRPYVEHELRAALAAEGRGNPAAAFAHLERAHILGQSSTVEHMRVHWRMFKWAWRHRHIKEGLGQLLRIAGAATKTPAGLVPTGNTGGANVSPFRRLPIPADLATIIERARNDGP